MNECIKAVHLDRYKGCDSNSVKRFGLDNAKRSLKFHQSFPEYSCTPLAELKGLAVCLGVKSICVKDESYRFGLNAFKGLGGSFCIGRYIAEKLGMDISALSYDYIIRNEVKQKLGDITFVTATDGNHGRGIAWTANRLGLKSVVYMPKGSSGERLQNIKALGSDASITELNYDDTVRYAKEAAAKNDWVLVQDTAWDGYETIPAWIMQGYTTMALEASEQLAGNRPTHIFLQAGVGAMAGALTGFFTDLYQGNNRPVITIVEPNKADCLFRTAERNNGMLQIVRGDMNTIMAGLACGEPCTIAWEILKKHADNFVSIPDWLAAKGMRILGNPLSGDDRIVSGESGAATLGLVAEVMQNTSLDWLRNQLKIDESAQILCFSTEGDTDQVNYRRIVWDGWYPSKTGT